MLWTSSRRSRTQRSGPPRYRRAERVRLAARALGDTTYDRLLADVAPADLIKAEVYPLCWDEPDALEWGADGNDGLNRFFGAAAAADDAVLVWLD
ncbi:YfbM family protein [Streptomyces albidocamelliae]|uniref:YfbM family protein n=1 Tax=Streptomyces albidocamelliae TaxID=2981135 RepID=A0ABY6F1C1_9ACTN|nr:YfbM family protein [Streptomyces sp. HUAS 14-6]UXY40241.1 YfbM family protein [Streptomyces sp. HUAS 14-6]